VLPDAAHNEKKLHENGTKRQNTCGPSHKNSLTMQEEQSLLPPIKKQTGVDRSRDWGGICRRERIVMLGGLKRWCAIGNLAGDGIGATRIIDGFTLKSYERPDKNKRGRDKAPQ
jgi:hypothetical protein